MPFRLICFLLASCLLRGCTPTQNPNRGVARLAPEGRPDRLNGCESRVALVIGNNQYRFMTGLDNAVSDAERVAANLRRFKFDTTVLLDASRQEMKTAIARFADKLGPTVVGLLYFAGHGTQLGGESYLLAIDSSATEEAVANTSLSFPEVYGKLVEREAALNLVVLDACRSNDFKAKGLARLADTQIKRSLIAYAAQPGTTADDIRSFSFFLNNGLENLHGVSDDEEVKLLFQDLKTSVYKQTNGRQDPFLQLNYNGDFYFEPRVLFEAPDGLDYVRLDDLPDSHGLEMGLDGDGRSKAGTETWVGATEVKVGSYLRFAAGQTVSPVGPAPYFNRGWQKDSHPVVSVTWKQASAYCDWVAGQFERTDIEGRLPSVSDWKRMAAWPDKPVNCYGTSSADEWEYTASVESLPSNAHHLSGLSDNVSEWLSSGTGPKKLIAGGSWASKPEECDMEVRDYLYSPDSSSEDRGFRCVLELPKCRSPRPR